MEKGRGKKNKHSTEKNFSNCNVTAVFSQDVFSFESQGLGKGSF